MRRRIERKTPATETVNSRAQDILEHTIYPLSNSEDIETFAEALQTFSDIRGLPNSPYKDLAEQAHSLLNALRSLTNKRKHIKVSNETKSALGIAPAVIDAMKQRVQAFMSDDETSSSDKKRAARALGNLDTVRTLISTLTEELNREDGSPQRT